MNNIYKTFIFLNIIIALFMCVIVDMSIDIMYAEYETIRVENEILDNEILLRKYEHERFMRENDEISKYLDEIIQQLRELNENK